MIKSYMYTHVIQQLIFYSLKEKQADYITTLLSVCVCVCVCRSVKARNSFKLKINEWVIVNF